MDSGLGCRLSSQRTNKRQSPAGLEDVMAVLSNDPILRIANQVTYCLSQCGYAFVEDDQVEALADTLKSFLNAAGIPVNEAEAAARFAETATQ
jgi:hypothetical protein